ncbi:MAG TPA: CPBP family intramembrane glutamic endopeptidase [Candidatus Acidoferrales bacterium]|nr:CPBP family intramembrane glutamic endopeptidase [Candidatus Acidoferrales bacterium]
MNFDENKSFDQDLERSSDSSGSVDSSPPAAAAPASSLVESTNLVDGSGASEYRLPPNTPVAEDLQVPWGWADLAAFIALAIAGFLLLSLIITTALAIAGFDVRNIQNSPREVILLNILIQVILDLGLLAYLALQMRRRFRSAFWRTIGWRKLETGRMSQAAVYLGLILGGLFLSIIVSVGSALFPPKKDLPIESLFQDRSTTFLFMLIAVLLAPVVEETIFRGYIYPVIGRSFGKFWGIMATGTLFGLLHAGQLWGGWGQIVLLVFVGVALTFARAVSRNVLPGFIIHTSYNSVQVIGLLIATHGLRQLPGVH